MYLLFSVSYVAALEKSCFENEKMYVSLTFEILKMMIYVSQQKIYFNVEIQSSNIIIRLSG